MTKEELSIFINVITYYVKDHIESKEKKENTTIPLERVNEIIKTVLYSTIEKDLHPDSIELFRVIE